MIKVWLLRAAIIGAALLAWQALPERFEFFVSRPSLIARSLAKQLADGSLLFHTAITAGEAFGGFFLGGLLGAATGLMFGRFKLLADVFDPILVAFYSLPKVALAPLFIMWFGLGFGMKVIYSAIIVYFLVFLNTFTGVRNVSRELLTIVRLMGAGELQLMTKIVIPAAFTWIFAGLRLSVPYALIGAILGEIMAANRGLGFIVTQAASQFDAAGVFSGLVAMVALGLTLNLLVRVAERWLMPWKQVDELREVAV